MTQNTAIKFLLALVTCLILYTIFFVPSTKKRSKLKLIQKNSSFKIYEFNDNCLILKKDTLINIIKEDVYSN